MSQAIVEYHPSLDQHSGAQRESGLQLGTLLGGLSLLWGYSIYALGTLWYSNDAYAYGWLVPMLCLALGYERWKRRPASGAIEGAIGPIVVSAAFLLLLLASAACLEVVPGWRFAGWGIAFGAIGVTFCALYLWGGRPWVNHFAFPLLFFLVAVPWPSRVEMPVIEFFSKVNAAVSTWIANLLGTPAIRVGTLIQTGTGLVGVDEACSGIRSFQSSVMIALFLGELLGYGFFRRVFFLLAGTGLALVCNVVRTTFLVRTCDLKGPEAVTANHDPAGFAILGITLAGLLLIAWTFRPRPQRNASRARDEAENQAEVRLPATPDSASPMATMDNTSRSRALPVLGVLIAVLLAASEVWKAAWYQEPELGASAHLPWSVQMPQTADGYREIPITPSIVKTLAYDEGKHAEWRDSAGHAWQAFYFRWAEAQSLYRASISAGQARSHAPDICLQSAGMRLEANLRRAVGQVNGIPVLLTFQRFLDRGRPLHVLTCYWEPRPLRNLPQGSPSTGTGLRLAIDSIRSRDHGRAEKRVIKIAASGFASDAEAEAAFSSLLQPMLKPM